MFRISSDSRTWTLDVPLDSPIPLRDFLQRLAREVSPQIEQAVARDPHSFFASIRIAVDRSFLRSDDYDAIVSPDSTVTIMGPYIDG